MSNFNKKYNKNKTKLNISEKMATKSSGRRSKKARLAGKEPPVAFFSALDVEIKEERIDDDEAIAAAVADFPDIKPDLNELNKELLLNEAANAVVLPPSVLPTLFIISQLPQNSVANATATAALTQATATTITTTAAAALLPDAANNCGSSTGMAGIGANAVKFLEDALARNEFDLQESDSDEDGFSDIDFDDDDELVEDDEDTDYYDPQWSDHPTAPRMVFNFDTPSQNIGLYGLPKSVEPSFYIERILGSKQQFFTKVANSSNAWVQHQMVTNKVGKIYLKDITSDEMEIFLGICLQMSTLKLRSLADYWNERSLYGFKGFAGKMSLNRFQMIMRVLNFAQLSESHQAGDSGVVSVAGNEQHALATVLPLLDFFNSRMLKIYNCGQRLVLNEPIIFWKGKLNWFNDLSAKFRCNAVMLHLLTENTGLVQKLVIDVERKERRENVRNSKLLVTQRVALAKDILREKLLKGHTVYASKYYGSYALAHELATHQTYCTGYVDNKRYGNCKELILTNFDQNTFSTKYAASIMMGKCRKREKCVCFFSSDCLAIYANETSIRTFDRRLKIIKELDWQLKLNEEIKEHMLAYQLGLDRKELKWDKQLIIYIFNLIVFNAFILYRMHAQLGRARIIELHLRDTTELKTFGEFREEFIASLLNGSAVESEKQSGDKKEKKSSMSAADSEEEPSNEETKKKDKATAHNKLLEVEHMPMIIPRRKGKTMKKKCRICRKGGMLTFSKLCCEVCPGMPGLCETPCFKIWHEQLKKSLEAGGCIKTRIFGTSGRETIYF